MMFNTRDRILTELKLIEDEGEHPAVIAFSALHGIMDYTISQAPSRLHGIHLICACLDRTIRGEVEDLMDKES